MQYHAYINFFVFGYLSDSVFSPKINFKSVMIELHWFMYIICADACQSSPCLNSAVCERINAGDYHCQCKPGYSGKNCEIGK